MRPWVIVGARRWWLLMAMGVVAPVLGAIVGAAELHLPGADGPRVLRQYLVVGLPLVLATALLDRLPEVSSVLRREPALRMVDQLLVVTTFGIALTLAWSEPGIPYELLAYEACTALLMMDWILLGTSRWGLSAILGGTLVAMVWLLAGDTVARLVGFGELGESIPGLPSGIEPRGWVLLGFAAAALPVTFGLGVSWRWRRA